MGVEKAIEEYRRVVEEKISDVQAAKKKLDQLIELERIKLKRLKGEQLRECFNPIRYYVTTPRSSCT